MADFTETFNVEEGMWESYRRFIERLRNLIAVRFSHNHAVTPDEVPPIRFFDIEFQTNTHQLTVRFRRDNLYFVGYRMQGTNQWLELRHDNYPQHRIPGSNFLTFHDSYDALRARTAADVRWNQINVGRQELINAINHLATSMEVNVRAYSIIVFLLMINESLRFNQITNHFTTHRSIHATPSWIVDFLHGWGTLSESLLHVDADVNFRLPRNNRFQVNTVEAALAIIGILKGHFFGPGPGPVGRRRRMAGDDVFGRPLVEVFSVTINNINGNSNTRGDIYGTIQFSDGLSSSQSIYNRGMNDSESIHTSGTISLNGPPRCITAYDDFIFEVALKSKEGLSEDDDVSRGEISWHVMNITANRYDQILRHQVTGQNGASATIKYAVLNNAVQAKIEIKLINTYGGEAIDVYGQIAAHNNKIEEESVLFRKASNKYINIKPGLMIPLSRSVVAVPMNSTLIVRADLKESSSFGPDDEIANGQATFSAQLSGTDEQNISTISPTRYRIKVKVTWSWYV